MTSCQSFSAVSPAVCRAAVIKELDLFNSRATALRINLGRPESNFEVLQ